MYSKINIDVSTYNYDVTGFETELSRSTTLWWSYVIFLRGSSTRNNDSAHVEGGVSNYVSYYIKSIKFKYDTAFNIRNKQSSYFVFFKIPYESVSQIRNFLVPSNISSIKELALYSHPENILGYDMFKRIVKPKYSIYPLYRGSYSINKPFILSPNEVVVVVYYLFAGGESKFIEANVEVEFKPL